MFILVKSSPRLELMEFLIRKGLAYDLQANHSEKVGNIFFVRSFFFLFLSVFSFECNVRNGLILDLFKF